MTSARAAATAALGLLAFSGCHRELGVGYATRLGAPGGGLSVQTHLGLGGTERSGAVGELDGFGMLRVADEVLELDVGMDLLLGVPLGFLAPYSRVGLGHGAGLLADHFTINLPVAVTEVGLRVCGGTCFQPPSGEGQVQLGVAGQTDWRMRWRSDEGWRGAAYGTWLVHLTWYESVRAR